MKFLGRFVQLTSIGERIGQPDARVEVCRDLFQSALVHFGHFVETLLGPKKLHKHFASFGLPRLDAERLLQQADGDLCVALASLDPREEEHLVIRARGEADDLFEMLDRFVGSPAREKQARETAPAIHVSGIEAHGLAESVDRLGREIGRAAIAQHREIERAENTLRRRHVGVELDRMFHRLESHVELSHALVETREGNVRIGGFRIEPRGRFVALDGLSSLSLPLVHACDAVVVIGLGLCVDGRRGVLRGREME